ncbi:MAG: dephospho-CoA kinase [Flavobacteriales bacterium]|nr:dephospho-CoA kinase [Flavobacteriales bacterium]
MYSVGLTGGIGSGKSTVARVFGVLGIPVFNADDESKRLLGENESLKQAVITAFGESLYPNGDLDRAALASIVFGNPEALARLNAIAHPALRKRFSQWVDQQRSPYVLLEAALLVDTGWYKSLDQLIVVSAPEEERTKRVMARDGISAEQVQLRMRNQISDEQRSHVANMVIENNGKEMIIPQVLALHERLLAKASE